MERIVGPFMEEVRVESMIATMLKRYESGGVTRRELIQGLAALATAATATPAAAAGFEVIGLDHVQINASDAKRSAEWYQHVFGLKPIRAGAMTDESQEIAHVGTEGNLLISFRKYTPYGKVDHIGLRLSSSMPQDALAKEIKARGAEFHPPDPKLPPGSYLHDPDGLRIQLGGKVATKPY